MSTGHLRNALINLSERYPVIKIKPFTVVLRYNYNKKKRFYVEITDISG